MCPTLLQGSFDKIKIAKNQLTRVSAQGIESVNRPVDLGFPKACSMICLNTLSRCDKYLGNFNHVARAISQKRPGICHSYTRKHRRVVKYNGVQAGKHRIGWWHVMQIINLTAFYMKGLSTTSACYKMSDFRKFRCGFGGRLTSYSYDVMRCSYGSK